MRYVVAIALGLLSGLLIYFIAALAFVGDGESISGAFVFVTLVGGWAVSSWMFVRETRTVSRVIRRACLVGAAEWLAMIPAGMWASGRAFAETPTTTDAEAVGAALGAGFVTVLTGGIAVVMTVICLLVFAVTYFLSREMQREAPEPIESR